MLEERKQRKAQGEEISAAQIANATELEDK
jgi:hypothetical protein